MWLILLIIYVEHKTFTLNIPGVTLFLQESVDLCNLSNGNNCSTQTLEMLHSVQWKTTLQ